MSKNVSQHKKVTMQEYEKLQGKRGVSGMASFITTDKQLQ